jgi:nicotinamidase-related amidase
MSKVEMLTPQNSAIALIDYQPAMYQGVQSHDRLVPFNNIQILAKAAKLFKIPTVLSTVAKDSFSGPFMPEVTELFPNHDIIDRTSMNSWLDAGFRKAVAATGRKKFVIAGLWTEACVMFPTLDMLREGYEIYIPADACGDLSLEAHNRAMDRAAAGLGALRNLRRCDGHSPRAFALRNPGSLLEMGAGRACFGGRHQGCISAVLC